MLCTDDHGKNHRAKVVGQVRDRTFIVAITANKNMKTITDNLAERAKIAAEQVAGALF